MRWRTKKWLNSLRIQVFLVFIAGSVLSIALIAIVAGVVLNTKGTFFARMDLTQAAQKMAHEITFDAAGTPTGFSPRITNGRIDFNWIFDNLDKDSGWRILNAQGQVALASTASPQLWQAMDAMPLEPGSFRFEHQGIAMRAATSAIVHNGHTWYFQLTISSRFMYLMYDAFALPFMVKGIGLFSVVLFFVFGPCLYITLRHTLAPLRTVAESAAAISPRSIHARLSTAHVPSEISPMVDSFNHVLQRLEQGYRAQQEFLGNAAHELKTPLSLIRAQIELTEADPEMRAALLSDVQYMSRQVQQLLMLAEASEQGNYQLAPTLVIEVVEEAAAYLDRMAEAAQVGLHLQITQARSTQWNADRSALFTLLKNLLENAIQHAPAHSSVDIEVHSDHISVRDYGPPIDTASLTRLSERFWRAPQRRDQGAGLGLPICLEIAQAHDWTLAIERAEPGLRVTLSLTPASARPSPPPHAEA
ncbi:two-component sensor histidine kinase [Lampropedia aestuarii]|uniref:histidine kinase n=1 Tax=Lampropedia aestuarii TaxID=2562762 RepID=A0A4S5BX57_9BURK|nr:ATP-binding protein [Lampropedia aestuarii]MDH5857693.1 ATP-binding protein [Lampropedia aestuarii]THJ36023.1 two-component sensor histidine kinase [Lampropedia aestuarii]